MVWFMSSGWDSQEPPTTLPPKKGGCNEAAKCNKDHVSTANRDKDSNCNKYCHFFESAGTEGYDQMDTFLVSV